MVASQTKWEEGKGLQKTAGNISNPGGEVIHTHQPTHNSKKDENILRHYITNHSGFGYIVHVLSFFIAEQKVSSIQPVLPFVGGCCKYNNSLSSYSRLF